MLHHTGHGVGLDDQERPWIIPNSKEKIEESQVRLIELGIYSGATGRLRIEDCDNVTGDGCEKVSSFPLDL